MVKFGVALILLAVHVVVVLGRVHRPAQVAQGLSSLDTTTLHMQTAALKPHATKSSNASSAVAVCGESLWRPDSPSVCPSSCPFLRPSDDKFCSFRCVTKEGCDDNSLLVGFADPETHHCTACLVSGCKTCKGSSKKCSVCDEGYELIDDTTCLSKKRYFWWAVYAALAVGALFVIVYVVCLIRRPIVNADVLEKAETHRSYTKYRNPDAGHNVYPLKTNLTKMYIAGSGVMLHFRWQLAMLAWAMMMLLVTGLPALEAVITGWPTSSSATAVPPGHPRTFDICRTESGHLGERVAQVESRYLIITVAVYLMTFVAAIFFAVKQRNFFLCEERRMVTMNDFALLVCGLPQDKGDARLEEEYLTFFREKLPGISIVGISIIWNTGGPQGENRAKVIKCIHKEVHKLEWEEGQTDRPPSSSGDQQETPQSRSNCCSMEMVDALFLGCDCACCGTRKEKKDLAQKELLLSMETTGYAFLIFQSEEDVKAAIRSTKETNLCFRQKFNLKLQHTQQTPQTTLWSGYSVGNWGFGWQMFLDFVYMTLLIGLWTALFYFPYADYIMSQSHVRGETGGGAMQGTLLGLLTVIGNQLVYLLCLTFAGRSGFRSKDMRDCFYCLLYLSANLVNTCLDMWTVYLLAQGQSRDIVQGKVTGDAPTFGDQMDHPSIRQALYEQLFAYLWPSTMFFSFCFEPIFLGIVPYYLGAYMIRSRRDVHTHAAELCLECPPFDLSRYIDILIVIMLCTLMTFLATIQLWFTFAALVFSLMFVYTWDQFRFLRLTQRTEFDQDTMDKVVQWLTTIPCAMLGVAVVLRAHGAAGYTVAGLDYVQKKALATVCAIVFMTHLVVHLGVLHWFVPCLAKRNVNPRQSKPYDVAASAEPCNWFTANQVQCLRSRYIYEHSPACTPYVCGKEYLLRKNPELGLYYEQPKVVPEDGLLHQVKELEEGIVKDIEKSFG